MPSEQPEKPAKVSYPPSLCPEECDHLITVVKDWALAHGLAVRPPPAVVDPGLDPGGILATNVAVTLFPSPFPKVCFEEAKDVQKAYNHVYAAVSQDVQFLEDILKE